VASQRRKWKKNFSGIWKGIFVRNPITAHFSLALFYILKALKDHQLFTILPSGTKSKTGYATF
jgi:hypothetical protein